jgi:hypothetical protein
LKTDRQTALRRRAVQAVEQAKRLDCRVVQPEREHIHNADSTPGSLIPTPNVRAVARGHGGEVRATPGEGGEPVVTVALPPATE